MLSLVSIAAALAADAPPDAIVGQAGVDYGRGNLVGIQPWMTSEDYASEEAFRARLAGWFEVAKARGWLFPETVVVLPEHVGTWLVAVGEEPDVMAAGTVDDALRLVGKRHLGQFVARALASGAKERGRDAVFHLKAPEMAAAYDLAFSRLAQEYGVTIVAGSILLPAPEVLDGRVVAGKGRLQNVSAVYGPDGRAHAALARLVSPSEAEKRLVRGADLEALTTYETPLGRLGVLVGADAGNADAYDVLAGQGVDVLAAPALRVTSGTWAEPASGASGVAGLGADAGAEGGLDVFLRGRIWDLGASGHTIGALGHEKHAAADVDGPAVFNLWLGEPPISPEGEEEAEAALAPSHPGLRQPATP